MWLRITVRVIDMHIEELDIEGAWAVTTQIHADDLVATRAKDARLHGPDVTEPHHRNGAP